VNLPWSHASTLADLEAEGYDHLSVYCGRCRGITTVWFSRLGRRWHESEGLGEIASRLRCERCGERPEPKGVRPERQGEARGLTKEYPGHSQ
jgi:hypothetical protein